MEKFRLIPLLTAAVMGCTALAGCERKRQLILQGRGGHQRPLMTEA